MIKKPSLNAATAIISLIGIILIIIGSYILYTTINLERGPVSLYFLAPLGFLLLILGIIAIISRGD
jgi:hypothetical protein